MKYEVFLLLLFWAFPVIGQEQEVKISIEAPENVIAGMEFKVVVTFNKGDLRDYSRFSQELPEGITAKNLSSPNADFTFNDQRLRIIWLKLPVQDVVRIVYMLKVHERLKGELKLSGTFAYVKDGERAFIDITDPQIVTISPNPDVDPELVVDIEDFSKIGESDSLATDEAAGEGQDFFSQIIRQTPTVDANGVINVNLLVKKPATSNFLKIEELIPSGYRFEAVEALDAVVSQSSSIVRFVWMKAPAQEVFALKYRLIPIAGQQQGEMLIDGNMTFNEDGKSQVESIRQMDVDIIAMNKTQQLAILQEGSVPEEMGNGLDNPVDQNQQSAEDTDQQNNQTVGQDVAETTQENETANNTGQTGTDSETTSVTTSGSQQETKTTTTTTKPGKSRYESVYVKTRLKKIIKIEPLENTPGIYFRVQIGAIQKPYFARVVYAEYDILRDVKAEYIDTWHKFTLGSFNSYAEAAAFKERVLKETPTKSAFVVAYRDGNRVPLREVL